MDPTATIRRGAPSSPRAAASGVLARSRRARLAEGGVMRGETRGETHARRSSAPPLPLLAGLDEVVGPYARAVRLTGIPASVLAELALDGTAAPASLAGIVKQTAGPKAWRAASLATTTEERARILLDAIAATRAADESEAA
jgi:hypothetical protein